jgi:hypothetical protein
VTYVIPDRVIAQAKIGGWIGVDFDGTLFTFEGDTWVKWNVFGAPIKPMIERVLLWCAAGVPVRIVTARIGLPINARNDPDDLYMSQRLTNRCVVSGGLYSDAMMQEALQDHMVHHGLPLLPVQCYKGGKMIEFWDDRAIQVVPNTGRTLAEEHEAEMSALRGKQFQTVGAVTGRLPSGPPNFEEVDSK